MWFDLDQMILLSHSGPWWKMTCRWSIFIRSMRAKIPIDIEFNYMSIGIFTFNIWVILRWSMASKGILFLVWPLPYFRIGSIGWSKLEFSHIGIFKLKSYNTCTIIVFLKLFTLLLDFNSPVLLYCKRVLYSISLMNKRS